MIPLLTTAARHGRWILIAGLLAGSLLPTLAIQVKPHVGWMIALLLLTSCVRIGHRNALGALRQIGQHLSFALVLQIAAPLVFIGICAAIGWQGSLVTAITLMLIASPIAGSPNLAIMLDSDPAPALRQLVIGTAILPLTVLPVLFLVPEFGGPLAVAQSAFKLLMVILGAAALGFAIRHYLLREATPGDLVAIDGVSAILMAIVVIGLMSAVGTYLYERPVELLIMLVVVCLVNFGAQMAFHLVASPMADADTATAVSITAGNRNIALFLTALPAAITDPLLLFIGCYQIPMYLTPMLMKRFYRR